eukprot:11201812-Lingulodinium_polyedra.AAC.1
MQSTPKGTQGVQECLPGDLGRPGARDVHARHAKQAGRLRLLTAAGGGASAGHTKTGPVTPGAPGHSA